MHACKRIYGNSIYRNVPLITFPRCIFSSSRCNVPRKIKQDVPGESKYDNTNEIVQRFINDLHKDSYEKIYATNFGHVRFDSENIPDKIEASEIDEQYFGDYNQVSTENIKDLGILRSDLDKLEINRETSDEKPDFNLVDKQYFENPISSNNEKILTENLNNIFSKNLYAEKFSFIDSVYFQNDNEDTFHIENVSDFEKSLLNVDNKNISELFNQVKTNSNNNPKLSDKTLIQAKQSLSNQGKENIFDSTSCHVIHPKITSEKINKELKDISLFQKSNNEDSLSFEEEFYGKSKISEKAKVIKTAHDFALQERRKESSSTDQNLIGYKRILHSMTNLDLMTKFEFIHHLKNNIIYNKDGIVALNKTYGINVHGGTKSKRTKCPVLTDVLPDLAKAIRVPELHLIHRLDQTTTGCLLLSTDKSVGDDLKKLFSERKIIKKYYAITKGIPELDEGIIDIPIDIGSINGIQRMVLRPDRKGFKDRRGTTKRAITKYKVISSVNSASCIEVSPTTGITHQIRVHLGFGLGCPILGDHKYSNLKKLVPQRLPSAILDRLHLKQSKVRDLPLFLHCLSLIIPEYIEGKNIHIKAPLPSFFKRALQQINLGSTKHWKKVKNSKFVREED